jgi:hypothetical protein
MHTLIKTALIFALSFSTTASAEAKTNKLTVINKKESVSLPKCPSEGVFINPLNNPAIKGTSDLSDLRQYQSQVLERLKKSGIKVRYCYRHKGTKTIYSLQVNNASRQQLRKLGLLNSQIINKPY